MLVLIMLWSEYWEWYKINILEISSNYSTRVNHATREVEIVYPGHWTVGQYNCAYKLWNRKFGDGRKKAVFLTLQDFKRRPEDFNKLKLFARNIEYLFSDFLWIIESGKSDPLNLHIHILGIINNKNIKRAINIEYTKIFKSSIIENDFYHLKQWRKSDKMPPYDQWFYEKIDYFDNNLKGDHANLIDYTKTGGFGVSSGFLYFLNRETH